MFELSLLGNRIKSLRIRRGLSQDKLAEQAGLNGKYLGEVERGRANISISKLAHLADALQVPLASIMSHEHEQDRMVMVKQLQAMIEGAEKDQLIVIYRILEAVMR